MFKKKVLSRFLGIYIGIVAIYTILISILSFNNSNKMHIIENNYANLIYMEQISSKLDHKIDTALKYVDKLSKFDSILNHLNNNSTNYIYTTNIFNDLLKNIQTFDELGFSVGITKFFDNFVITPEGTFKYDYFIDKINLDKTYLNSLNDLFINKKNKGDYLIVPSYMNLTDSPYFTIIRKLNYDEFTPELFFFITFDKSSFIPNNLPNDSGIFNLYTNTLINSSSNNYEYSNTFNFEQLSDGVNTMEKDNLLNYVIKSNVLKDMKYIYTIDKKFLQNSLTYLFKSMFILNIILIILGIIIIYNATRISYEPIKKLLNIFNKSHNNINNIDELEFLKQNIEDIFLVNKTLEENLNSSLNTLQENFFRKILYGLIDTTTIPKEILKLNLNTYIDTCTLCLLDIEGVSNIERSLSTKHLISLRTSILSIFNNNSIKYDFFVIPLDYKNFCLIFPNDNFTLIYDKVNYIINTLENDLSLDIIASLPLPVDNINNLSNAFHESLKLIDYKYSFTKGKIITNNNINDLLDETYFYPLDLENYIVKYANNDEFSKSINLISKILDKNINDIKLNPSSITRLKFALINTIKRILNENDKTLKEFSAKNKRSISHFNESTINTLKENTIKLFKILFEDYLNNNLTIENSTVSNILLYIQQNFDKDICLTDIANHFNLSEGYISKLLKNSININFKTYVNGLKVKKAKELLAKGTFKVNEVSKIVGCENTNTFIRIFKKYESISPGEYLKSLLNYKNS